MDVVQIPPTQFLPNYGIATRALLASMAMLICALFSGHATADIPTDGEIIRLIVSSDDGTSISGAIVNVASYNRDGEKIWSGVLPATDKSGVFSITKEQLPDSRLVESVLLSASAPWHLASEAYIDIHTENLDNLKIKPQHIELSLKNLNPWLLLALLAPAIVALPAAIWQLRQNRDYAQLEHANISYAMCAGLLWGAAVSVMASIYVATGDHLIPLFSKDLKVSSGVVVASYLGVMVYTAWSVYQRTPEFFEQRSQGIRQKVTLTIGGRILAAPYIAVTTFIIISQTFPSTDNSGTAWFLGVFTGLYIKPVLGTLNSIGMKLLSAQENLRPHDFARGTADQPILVDADIDFDSAVIRARKEFDNLHGVIGVSEGQRQVGKNSTGERAIVAYVLEKRNLAQKDPNLIPPTFDGYPVDVQSLPRPETHTACNSGFAKIDWARVHRTLLSEGRVASRPKTIVHNEDNEFLVVVDEEMDLFHDIESDHDFYEIFDVFGAFKLIEGTLPAATDFVTFLVDTHAGLPQIDRDYYLPVNELTKSGTGHNEWHTMGGHSFSGPEGWGSTRVQACQVHTSLTPEPRILLHELGHTWCAYASYNEDRYGLLNWSDAHWSSRLASGNSCMSQYVNDLVQWKKVSSERYQRINVDDSDFGFSKLDLYLMGLLAEEEVGEIDILRRVASSPGSQKRFAKVIEKVTIEQVIEHCGQRVPPFPTAKKCFNQVFVVLTKKESRIADFSTDIKKLIENHTRNFHKATRVNQEENPRASLKTHLT